MKMNIILIMKLNESNEKLEDLWIYSHVTWTFQHQGCN